MEIDLLLINPPLTLEERYGSFAKMGSEAPPLGICVIAACVRKEGYNVKIVDAPAQGLNLSATVEEVKRMNPKSVGISSTTNSICNTYALARELKKTRADFTVIVGGCHITALPEETLEECESIDMGVIGEGEISMPEILRLEKEGKKDLSEVKGIIYRVNGHTHRTPPRKYIENLDTLPFPAWDLLSDLPTRYKPSPHSYLKLPSTSLVTTRGCNGKCIYCVRALSEEGYRSHSADYTLGMIDFLIKKYNIKDILFYDDNFLLDKARINEICEQILKKKFKISWSCLARPEIIPEEMLTLMKRSGCWQIAYGIESGDQGILNTLKKGVKLERVEKVLETTVKAGIRTRGYFMIGCPGETKESIAHTIDFLKSARLKDFHATFFTPLPGTEIFNTAHKYGHYTKDWSRMSVWTPLFIPQGLTREKLISYHRKMYREFYFRPKVLLDYAYKLFLNPAAIPQSFIAGIDLLKYSFFKSGTSSQVSGVGGQGESS